MSQPLPQAVTFSSMRSFFGKRAEKATSGLSESHMLLLGSISASSAMLEQTLGSTLRGQLGLETPLSNILVSGMNINTLTDKVMRLARYQLPNTTVLEDLERWVQRVRGAARKRNLAIHSSWISNPTPGTIQSSSFTKDAVEGTFTSRTWTEEELKELVGEIEQLAGELVGFWWRMGLIAGKPGESPSSKSSGHV
jgi:hypothetical protein